ncbi:VOC family protein [Isoptericola sp. NEAU-Y5]|uniref:VOC family protein n=1 Tax=Isoptericola luteus TaxID=2879484 RepID=A0ABS7ZIU0_9MICO|nr:VOC family protein [Isoptericola sp. NEAU-Y5]MCA5894932.1 VOC family protein [Isoptericola sp. NEAU-Y5]
MDLSPLHPNLTVADPRAAIDFYVAGLGAEVLDTITAGDAIIHSDLRITSPSGASTFTVAAAFPAEGAVAPEPDGATTGSFTLYVDDADAAHARAVAAGATSTQEPGDWFPGFRQAAVRCPAGHRWFFAQVDDGITAADVQRASDAWMAEQS